MHLLIASKFVTTIITILQFIFIGMRVDPLAYSWL